MKRKVADDPSMRIVIGLGNPGAEYDGTRHNIGFRVVDCLAAREGWKGARERFRSWWLAGAIGEAPVALMKPTTYMNRSGLAVREAAAFYKVPPARLLVVCDDFHLPLGVIRYRARGSSGGQKGLASVLEALGTDAVPRLRVGVGGIGPLPAGADGAAFVLGRFGPDEAEAVETAVEAAATRARSWAAERSE